ncbi:MAG TPA: adenylate/guanylate cyclase domain-containing protein, partial [Motiliproteus sp.]
LLYGFVTACGGLLLSLLIARRIVRPIQSLVQGTQAISNGRYDYHIDYRSKDEIGQLATAFNRMTSGLREKEFIRSTFNRYLNPNIIDRILADPQQLQLGGERQRQTMLFSDLVNFTQICEQMPPVQLIGLLNDYLSAMTEIVDNHQGIVDKYIGDAIMAYWGPLSTGADHASQACLAAHTMRLRLNELQQQWRERGLPILQIRIGIATGEMIVGNIGSEQNCNYTCIGDTVNICSRLESTNKLYGTDILVDHDTAKEAQGLLFRELDSIQVKGREGSMAVFALIRPDDQALTNTESSLLAGYAKALQLYYTGDFATAQSAFEQLAQRWPTDTATQAMLKRCLELKNTPPADWRGVYKIQVK